MQLLEPEYGFSAWRVTKLGYRIRDGLLRDNKVVPAVLGGLALLIFAWLIAGALIGGPGGEEGKQRASSQASLAPEDSKNGSPSGTPAPEAENRDTESFAAFKPKDPFRQLIPKASETTNESTTSTKSGSRASKSGGSTSRSTGSSSKAGGGGFIDQTFPGGSNGGAGGGDRGPGEGEDTSGVSIGGGGAGRSGNVDLFNSGGDLPAP